MALTAAPSPRSKPLSSFEFLSPEEIQIITESDREDHSPKLIDFFEARIENLSIRDRVKIECTCGRVALIAVQGLGLRIRCRSKALSTSSNVRIAANAARRVG
jgi:hypothetical protein